MHNYAVHGLCCILAVSGGEGKNTNESDQRQGLLVDKVNFTRLQTFYNFEQITFMAKNGKVGDGHRIVTEKAWSQVYNPVTGNYVKRDLASGKFIGVKSDGKAFKGVARESQITNIGISISKDVAQKAEESVIKTINRKSK